MSNVIVAFIMWLILAVIVSAFTFPEVVPTLICLLAATLCGLTMEILEALGRKED